MDIAVNSRPDGGDRAVVWFDGRVVPTASATVHIGSETALRGANVFEGIRAYVDSAGAVRFLALGDHLERLMTSAALLGITHPYTVEGFVEAIASLLHEAGPSHQQTDLYVRPSICIGSGRLPSDPSYRAIDYVAIAKSPRVDLFRPATGIVSRWRKPADSPLPAQIKAGGSYLGFRLPLLEKTNAGVDAVILLNEHGMVAEAEGAAICMIHGGALRTPPARDGGLRSITRRIVLDLAIDTGLPVYEDSIRHSELYEAAGIFLAGTLCELQPLAVLDGVPVNTVSTPAYLSLAERYDELRKGAGPVAGWCLESIERRLGDRHAV